MLVQKSASVNVALVKKEVITWFSKGSKTLCLVHFSGGHGNMGVPGL